jgi:hypothetical protein
MNSLILTLAVIFLWAELSPFTTGPRRAGQTGRKQAQCNFFCFANVRLSATVTYNAQIYLGMMRAPQEETPVSLAEFGS